VARLPYTGAREIWYRFLQIFPSLFGSTFCNIFCYFKAIIWHLNNNTHSIVISQIDYPEGPVFSNLHIPPKLFLFLSPFNAQTYGNNETVPLPAGLPIVLYVDGVESLCQDTESMMLN
jgi:hypothetical protein